MEEYKLIKKQLKNGDMVIYNVPHWKKEKGEFLGGSQVTLPGNVIGYVVKAFRLMSQKGISEIEYEDVCKML